MPAGWQKQLLMAQLQNWICWVNKTIKITFAMQLLLNMEKLMTPHSSTLAWKIPWTEEPGRLQCMGLRSRTQLSDFTFTFHFHALEKEMVTHSSVLAWRIPGMGEPGGLPSMGSHRVRHDWSDLAVAVAVLCNNLALWTSDIRVMVKSRIKKCCSMCKMKICET